MNAKLKVICIATAALLPMGCAMQPAAPSAPAQLLQESCPRLPYPEASALAGEEGTVRMSFQLDASGKVDSKEITGSSGYPHLDKLTVEGLSQCRFAPATRRGTPVRSSLALEYTWTVQEEDLPIDDEDFDPDDFDYDPYPDHPDL